MTIIETNLPTNGSFIRRTTTNLLVLHHAAATTATVEQINQWHLNNGWVGIGYHYYVRKNGRIYRGRPEWAIGSHALGYNSRSIGICCEGNFMTEIMPNAQFMSLSELVRDVMSRYNGLTILRHRDVNSTSCPGTNFPFERVLEYQALSQMTESRVRMIAREEIASARIVYRTVDEVPIWGRETVIKLIEKGYLNGTVNGLNLTEEMLRILVLNDRAGVYDRRPEVYQTLEEVPIWGRETMEKLIENGFFTGAPDGLQLTNEMLRVFVVHDRAGLYDTA